MTISSMFAFKPLRAAATAVLALSLSVSATAIVAAQAPVDSNTVIGTVNGQPIREIDIILAAQRYGIAEADIPAQRLELIDDIINSQLIAAAASSEGLDQDPDFLIRLASERTSLLVNAYLTAHLSSQLTPETIQARYQAEVGQVEWPRQVRSSHILVATEAEALDIIQQLNNGADFAALAATRSLDTISASQGGDIGFQSAGATVPEYDAAMFRIPVGTIGQAPVQTEFGWHVIRVDEERTQPAPALDEVADQIAQMILSEQYRDLAAQLRQGVTIAIPELDAAASVPATPAP